MVQAEANNNMSVMNEINYDYDYDYARANNKGIILLSESLLIDIIPKIESLTIKLKNIDENENKKINVSRNERSYFTLMQKKSLNSKAKDECLSYTCSK